MPAKHFERGIAAVDGEVSKDPVPDLPELLPYGVLEAEQSKLEAVHVS